MIPKNSILATTPEEVVYPSKNHCIRFEDGKIQGFIDGLEAVKQAIRLILFTERYAYPIYSHNYGVELEDCFGKPISWVLPELKRRISEALLQDDRIKSVDNFKFQTGAGKVTCEFTVGTEFGDISLEKEVAV